MVFVKYSKLCDHSYTVTDGATLVHIMGWDRRVTDDDPACPCMAAILIHPPRLRDSLSLPAPLPGAPRFTGFMEVLSELTIFAMLFYLSPSPCFSCCSSLSCLISLLRLGSLSSVHSFCWLTVTVICFFLLLSLKTVFVFFVISVFLLLCPLSLFSL